MLQLHYFPGNASLIAHIVLEEIGAPFALKLVDRAQGEHKSAGYLALNPNGLIPVLVDDESARPARRRSCSTRRCHRPASRRHPSRRRPVARARHARARARVQVARLAREHACRPALILYFYPERWADDAAGAADGQGACRGEGRRDARADRRRARAPRRPLAAGRGLRRSSIPTPSCSAAGRAASPGRRAACRTSSPGSSACSARPAVQRAFATEQLAPPFV